MHPKLVWTHLLGDTLSGALGTSVVVTVRDHVDPLKKLVVLDLGAPLGKGNYQPLQTMTHAYAKANDCVVAAIRREGDRRLVLETLIKTRLGPVKNNDPFGDKGGPPKED